MVEDPMRRLTSPKDAYRQVNARSQGGAVNYGYSGYPSAKDFMQLTPRGSQDDPKVTSSVSVRPKTASEADVLQNPIQTQWKNRGNITPARNYQGRSANDYAWADRVNAMTPEQLDALLAPGTQAFKSGQSPVNTAKTWGSGKISASPGAPWPMINSQDYSETYRYDGGDGVGNAPPVSQQISLQNMVQGLANTPQQRQGFSMDSIEPRDLPTRRSEVPAWSLSGGASPETEGAFRDFQSTPIEERIMENLANAGAQGRQAMNDRVDGNLAASDRLGRTMGGADYRAAGRTGVIPPRGMGALPSDAGVMARLTQPLGDGGPAAYAARADQAKRQRQAEEAMGGVGADGMTRYMPNQDLLTFANQDRARGDQRISDIIGGGTNYRDPLKAMTPSEIQFYRHKMNMLTNPAYANRVNTQRADRQEMLDNRRDMVRARREGALEAAGESQQMRNLMAGRGAVGGNSALGALLGMASLQDPNEALRGFSQATMANQYPGMLRDRLIAEENMLATRAALGRMQQYENMRMQIIGSGMPEVEKQRALQSLNNSILSSQGGVPTNGGMNTFTSGSGTVNGIPNWLPLPEAFPDGNVPTVQRMAEYMQGLRSDPRWQNLPPDQQSAILSQIQSQYFPGIRESDRQQYLQDNATGLLSRLLNWGRGLFGMDEANMTRRQEALDAIAPYRAGSAPYQPGQRELTEDERRAVNEMPDSRDRILYENLLRDPSFRNYMQPSMQFPY